MVYMEVPRARCSFSDDFSWHLRTSLPRPSIAACVTFSVTTDAKCKQIVRNVPAKLASWLYVVNLQVPRGTAVLASPTISFQYLVSDHDVFLRREFESGLLLA